ncbi:50S ribosomal protein L29 [Candidatus Nomurabacteria bacterium]|nr:50S ribosomal protein L29 [Candidatus Nomurabacteria bacterium]
MAKMNEIKKMKDTELASLIKDKREVLRNFRFGTGGKDVGAMREARKDVARSLTELKTRTLDTSPKAKSE